MTKPSKTNAKINLLTGGYLAIEQKDAFSTFRKGKILVLIRSELKLTREWSLWIEEMGLNRMQVGRLIKVWECLKSRPDRHILLQNLGVTSLYILCDTAFLDADRRDNVFEIIETLGGANWRFTPDEVKEVILEVMQSDEIPYALPKWEQPEEQDFRSSTTIWKTDDPAIIKTGKVFQKSIGETGLFGNRAGSGRRPGQDYSGTYSPELDFVWSQVNRRWGVRGGLVLDQFCGGPTRGLVAGLMGDRYRGVDVRRAAIRHNRKTMSKNKLYRPVHYLRKDARSLPFRDETFDFAMTCPPYFDLEVYSSQKNDLSYAASYENFLDGMKLAGEEAFRTLKPGTYCCVKVGNFRDKKTGNLLHFNGDMVSIYGGAGFDLKNEAILPKRPGSSALRAASSWKGKKLVPCHEVLLVFQKPLKTLSA